MKKTICLTLLSFLTSLSQSLYSKETNPNIEKTNIEIQIFKLKIEMHQKQVDSATRIEDLENAKNFIENTNTRKELVQLQSVTNSNSILASNEMYEKFSALTQSFYSKKSQIQNGNVGKYSVKGRIAIIPGMMYLIGIGKGNYISEAYINEYGLIQARENLRRVSRVFPSFTGTYQFCENWYVGPTIGFNEGANNSKNGFALALGGSIGFIMDNGAHIGFFYGRIQDPSVRSLPWYIKEGLSPSIFLSGYSATDPYRPSDDSFKPGQTVPTQGVAGVYEAFGIVFSLMIK